MVFSKISYIIEKNHIVSVFYKITNYIKCFKYIAILHIFDTISKIAKKNRNRNTGSMICAGVLCIFLNQFKRLFNFVVFFSV